MQNRLVTKTYFALDSASLPLAWATGDEGNHTIRGIANGYAITPSNSPEEIDATNCPGAYRVTFDVDENVAEDMVLHGKSLTPGVILIPASWVNAVNVGMIAGVENSAALLRAPELDPQQEAANQATKIKAKTDLISTVRSQIRW